MHNRLLLIGGIVVALVCVLLTCTAGAGYYYYDDIQVLSGAAKPENITQLLPEDTQLFISVTPNLQALAGYESLRSLLGVGVGQLDSMLDSADEAIANQRDLTFREDILPWLGQEMAFVIPTISQSPSDFVLIAESRNQTASDAFISKILADPQGEPFTATEYQGVTVHHQPQPRGDYEEMILTTFDGFVLVSNSEMLVTNLIDRSRGSDSPSFTSNPTYQQLLAELPTSSVGLMYLDTVGLEQTLQAQIPFSLSAEQTDDLKAIQAMGAAISLQTNGFLVDAVTLYNTESLSKKTQAGVTWESSPNTVLQYVSQDALVSVNGVNFKGLWEQISQGVRDDPMYAMQMADLEEGIGFNMEEDIISWMTGEYAFVSVPVPVVNEFSSPIGGYMLLGSDDFETAQMKFNQIVSNFEARMGLFVTFEERTVGTMTARVMLNPLSGEPVGGYAFHDNYVVMAYPFTAFDAFAAATEHPLTENPQFQAIQGELPSPNSGYMYMNTAAYQQLAEERLDTLAPPDEPKDSSGLGAVQAAGMANHTEESGQGVNKSTFFFLVGE